MLIRVQHDDFNVSQIQQQLTADRNDIGAIVSFTGLVRDMAKGQQIHAMTLEHYPGMTESALTQIAEQAMERWQLQDCAIIHRVGKLAAGEQIVLTCAASPHRKDAFEACHFMMDYLKTQAPFWKKEHFDSGEEWVEAKSSDDDAVAKWS